MGYFNRSRLVRWALGASTSHGILLAEDDTNSVHSVFAFRMPHLLGEPSSSIEFNRLLASSCGIAEFVLTVPIAAPTS